MEDFREEEFTYMFIYKQVYMDILHDNLRMNIVPKNITVIGLHRKRESNKSH